MQKRHREDLSQKLMPKEVQITLPVSLFGLIYLEQIH